MSSCQKTLSGSELLLLAGQSSPTEVKMRCFYTVMSGNGHSSSPHSEISSIAIQTLLPPKLVVSTSVITETDTVTLDCQCPPVPFQCYFYTEGEQPQRSSCQKTLSGSELLLLAGQSSPTEVKMRCFYTVMSGNGHSSSPHSEISSIAIQTLLPPKLVVSTSVITETDRVTMDCQRPTGVFQCYFYTEGGPTQRSSCQKTLSGSELLLMAGQSSPAEVKVRCFYTVRSGNGHSSSPQSKISSITIQTLLPPKLVISTSVITETDTVTLDCQCPPGVFQCYFYTEGGPTQRSSCQKTLSGSELLLMAGQSSPAEVKVRCFYTVRSGNGHSSSPQSKISSITINTLLPPKLVVSTSVITETDTVTLDCQCPPGLFQCYFSTEGGPTQRSSCQKRLSGSELLLMAGQSSPAEVKVRCFYTVMSGNGHSSSPQSKTSSITIHKSVEIESHTMQTTQFPMTSGLTVSTRNPMGNVISTLRTPGEVTSALTVTTSRNAKEHVSTSSPTPEKPDMRMWTLKALGVTAAFGVTVGFISLGLTFHCTTRKSGNEKPNKQEPQNEQSVIYHKYDTISEEPSASAPNDMVYSTLQPV
ncbi:uncharacterized protein LOC128451433 isoform X4 [Pleuronectes platessa]|uniref:uncharacterized protein LOC128451433 isoform X4 n=1 Tax=Pleuronectes platessa TaxID=8262 RepID=UPI00232A20AB|nr:uncharacterized protein LOC128451433 isoform X4 [Pleuronectes platessa]